MLKNKLQNTFPFQPYILVSYRRTQEEKYKKCNYHADQIFFLIQRRDLDAEFRAIMRLWAVLYSYLLPSPHRTLSLQFLPSSHRTLSPQFRRK